MSAFAAFGVPYLVSVELLLAAGAGAGSLVFLLLLLVIHRRWASQPLPISRARRVLLVIAHPDDECMFFGPTICGLVKQRCDVRVLCLSSGDHLTGQGRTRKAELRRACVCLGLPASSVVVVDHSRMPDNAHVQWNKRLVSALIMKWVEALGIDTIISFDRVGVSAHRNHTAIFHALQALYSHGKLPANTQVLVLESINLLRKYTSLLDIVFSRYNSSFCYISNWSEIARNVSAMCHHWSQMVWFRWLYVTFSRYMIVNTLKRISMQQRFYRYQSSKDE